MLIVPFAIAPPAYPYANGTPVVIGENIAAGELDWAAGAAIYGGSNGGDVPSTSLTISNTALRPGGEPGAGAWTQVFGGGSNGNVVEGQSAVIYDGIATNPLIDGDYQVYFLHGGGGPGTTQGSTSVTIDEGRVRGWLTGAGFGTVNGSSTVDISGGWVGTSSDELSAGQGEVYGGPEGANGVVNGDTFVNVSGVPWNGQATTAGTTGIHQHVLGGGSQGGRVNGDTHVTVTGGRIGGFIVGGGGGGNGGSVVDGDTNVSVSGNTVVRAIVGSDANGGGVYGGAYGNANANTITGNASVIIFNSASGSPDIATSVYGGSRARAGILAGPPVLGSSSVRIEGGTIGVNVYGGGHSSTVGAGSTATITGGAIGQDAFGGGSGR